MDIAFERFGGYRVSRGCKRSCSSARRASNFNSKVPQGGIYPHIKRRQGLRAECGDAKTIVSPNTSFGDIINIRGRGFCGTSQTSFLATRCLFRHIYTQLHQPFT